jgi:hypothetical protein
MGLLDPILTRTAWELQALQGALIAKQDQGPGQGGHSS